MLYKRHNYLDRSVEFLINREIIEYDMQTAGFNLIREYKLLNSETIEMLEKMPKKQQTIQIGILQKHNKELSKQLKEAFIDGRRRFFEANHLENHEVLSIKKDAIVVLRTCQELEFGFIKFVPKNMYTSYYYLNRLEMYYNDETFDIKGISDKLLELHLEGMLSFLHQFCYYMEAGSQRKVKQFVVSFSKLYRERKLAPVFYRELNRDSMFTIEHRVQDKIYELTLEEVDHVEDLDIRFNYMRYVVPIISLLT